MDKVDWINLSILSGVDCIQALRDRVFTSLLHWSEFYIHTNAILFLKPLYTHALLCCRFLRVLLSSAHSKLVLSASAIVNTYYTHWAGHSNAHKNRSRCKNRSCIMTLKDVIIINNQPAEFLSRSEFDGTTIQRLTHLFISR